MLQGIIPPRDKTYTLQRLGRFCSFPGSAGQRDHCTPSGHSRCLKAEAKQQTTKPPGLSFLNLSHPPFPHTTQHTVLLPSSLQQDLQPCIFILCKCPVSSFAKLQLYPDNLTHAGPLLILVTVRFLSLSASGCSLGQLVI